jgi:hypothetical protein
LAKVLSIILDSFYQQLSESEAIDAQTVSELRALFQSGKKLKADDVVAIISGTRPERQ